MRFRRRLPNDTATLLLLSVFIIVILGLSDTVGDRASEHQVAISAIGAVCPLHGSGCGRTYASTSRPSRRWRQG